MHMKNTTPLFRKLDATECQALLARLRVGRIAYSFHDHVDIEPISYVFDAGWIFARTSIGSKLSSLAHHPWCAFEVDEVRGDFDWMSVVVKGSLTLLDPMTGTDTYARAAELLGQLVPGTFTLADPVPHRTMLIGIHIDEMSGRCAQPRA
ncbi:MAG: Pyridoxamine 5-phosphate oxidase-related protein [Gemmatimonadetes bacterium]|nr:Pyridoxamine 5-phosphate oxidase-related protein [Gemmatimonadota bacterium]